MPTRSVSASCGLGAIQRTCEVHGRGGKLHCGRDGMSWSATSSSQLSPSSRLQNRRLGSVPAYTLPSAALTATLNTSGAGNGTSSKLSPPSALRLSPPPRHPTYTVSPSSAKHCAPEPCRRVCAPTLTNASPVVANSSIPPHDRASPPRVRARRVKTQIKHLERQQRWFQPSRAHGREVLLRRAGQRLGPRFPRGQHKLRCAECDAARLVVRP